LIGRGPLRLSHVLTVSVLTAGLVCAGFLTHPSPAYAGSGEVSQTLTHVVSFDSAGSVTQHVTSAASVEDFLREQGIAASAHDYVSPALDVPLSDHLTVTYRAAVPVTIQRAHARFNVLSSAEDVGALLEEQHIRISSRDTVQPALAEPVPASGIVRISRINIWNRTEKHKIAAGIIHRFDFSLNPGTTKVVAKGARRPRRVAYLVAAAGIGNIQPSRTVRQLQQNPGDMSDRLADRQNTENCRTHQNDDDK